VPTKSKPKKRAPARPSRRPAGLHRPERFHIDKRADGLIAAAPPTSAMLTTAQMMVWLGVSHQWLEAARVRGDGPPFERIAPRLIRYDVEKVKAWLAWRKVAS
jgi:hypothetical protein